MDKGAERLWGYNRRWLHWSLSFQKKGYYEGWSRGGGGGGMWLGSQSIVGVKYCTFNAKSLDTSPTHMLMITLVVAVGVEIRMWARCPIPQGTRQSHREVIGTARKKGRCSLSDYTGEKGIMQFCVSVAKQCSGGNSGHSFSVLKGCGQ